MGELASDDPEARLAKSKSPPLTAANFFALKRELDISLLHPPALMLSDVDFASPLLNCQ
jgi:hypothetical protein